MSPFRNLTRVDAAGDPPREPAGQCAPVLRVETVGNAGGPLAPAADPERVPAGQSVNPLRTESLVPAGSGSPAADEPRVPAPQSPAAI